MFPVPTDCKNISVVFLVYCLSVSIFDTEISLQVKIFSFLVASRAHLSWDLIIKLDAFSISCIIASNKGSAAASTSGLICHSYNTVEIVNNNKKYDCI